MKNKVVYVCRDIERALGLEPSADFMIVTNRSEYAEKIAEKYPKFVHLIQGSTVLDTNDLLAHKKTAEIVGASGGAVVLFKTNSQAEALAKEKGWTLLNPAADLAEKIENKISQVEVLGDLANKYLPPHTIVEAGKVKPGKEPVVLQWAHSHSGEGTMLVRTATELAAIQAKFSERPVRVTDFVNGPTFTMNIVVSADNILLGNLSYQITGLKPFTDNQFTTVGNDWSVAHSILDMQETEQIEEMAREVGERLRTLGWKGLFGIDVIQDAERNKIFLIEINARQPASTTYESQLQTVNRSEGVVGLTTFEAHIATLQGESLKGQTIIPINDGAQILQRITNEVSEVDDETIGSLELAGLTVIEYANTEPNADLLRIQSGMGIIEAHNKLNKRGKDIRNILAPDMKKDDEPLPIAPL